ncbi:hypothetical protein [Roseibium aggregatum]|uniref:Holin n=1 Tax=Roseibium aggregatum TaxID=187304 RepID=A0A939EF59_9HYPH|nr:hypothetical protein [Roseibium aggregatum]MBN9671689.1 hypothetical protein [Roseibium aggregatum]
MNLVSDWRRVLQRAWSIRLIALAALLSGAEVALPFLGDFIAPGRLAALSALATAGAFVGRILAQKDMDDE